MHPELGSEQRLAQICTQAGILQGLPRGRGGRLPKGAEPPLWPGALNGKKGVERSVAIPAIGLTLQWRVERKSHAQRLT